MGGFDLCLLSSISRVERWRERLCIPRSCTENKIRGFMSENPAGVEHGCKGGDGGRVEVRWRLGRTLWAEKVWV